MSGKRFFAVTATLVFCLGGGIFPAIQAQDGDPEAGRQILSQSRSQPPAFPDHAADLSKPTFVPVDDEDLGTLQILQESHQYKPLGVSLTSGVYHTDNAGLDPADEVEDSYWWSAVSLSYLPQIKGGLMGDFSASYETLRYDSSGELDFDELEVGAGLAYVFRNLGDLTVYGRYNYDRITEPGDYSEVFVQHGIVTGFFKPFVIDRDNFAYLRGLAEFGVDANPSPARQNDYSLVLGYRFMATDEISLEPYYRIRYLDFDSGREDLSHTVGLGLNYQFSENWYAGISGYYIVNDSNHEFGDYEAGTVGGRLGLQVRF